VSVRVLAASQFVEESLCEIQINILPLTLSLGVVIQLFPDASKDADLTFNAGF
jgi:hypothetical protein